MVLSGETAARSGLIPLERELRERLAWFIQLRWLAALGITIGAWGATEFIVVDLSPLPLYGVALVVAAYNAFFLALRRRFDDTVSATHTYRRSIYAQIGLDWIALICLVHYTGGIQSPVTLAFVFHLIIGAILLSRSACYMQAGLASLLIGALLLLEESGLWTPVVVAELTLNFGFSPLSLLYRWVILSAFLGVTVSLTSSITAPLRKKEEALFRSEQELDRAYGEIEALYQMGQTVNATLDLEHVLGLIAENGARLMQMKACSIRLLERDGRHLRVGGAYGLGAAYLDKGPVELKRSRIDAEALAGGMVRIADATTDPRFQYPEEARREGIRSVLCAPLQAMGRSIGCIRVYSGERHHFSRAEENFLRNLANLGAVAIDNARAYADLGALSEERAWFARVTHHQLRSPLSAVKNMLDALRYAGDLSEKQQDFIERSRRRVDELLAMIRDLLDLAAAQRPLAGRQAESVVLFDCLSGALETVGDGAAHKGVTLEVEVPEDAAVLAAPEDVKLVFANLLDNAVKYTPGGGTVGFEVRCEGGWLLAAVSDTGIGVKPEDQEKIFEGFFRTEGARESGEIGTGMGLSIVKTLVERWGGELTLESANGEGSRFGVRLPAAE